MVLSAPAKSKINTEITQAAPNQRARRARAVDPAALAAVPDWPGTHASPAAIPAVWWWKWGGGVVVYPP